MKCLYCNEDESSHFICEKCGVGMCDSCYDADVEHDQHYNRPFENVDEKDLEGVQKALGFDDPDYICEDCMQKAYIGAKQ